MGGRTSRTAQKSCLLSLKLILKISPMVAMTPYIVNLTE